MSADTPVAKHVRNVRRTSDGGQVLALFDFDRTLIAGYSVLWFAWEQLRRGSWPLGDNGLEALSALERQPDRDGYRRVLAPLVKALKGTPEDKLVTFGESVFERHLASRVYREARELVTAHQRQGHRVAIVTAASRYQVAPVARSLGIEQVFCTELDVRDGLLSGELGERICHGQGKVDAARQLAEKYGSDLADAWFYSDSDSDLQLLSAVGNPVAVNPNAELRRLAETNSWTLLTFNSRGGFSWERVMRTALTANSLLGVAAAGALSYAVNRSSVRAGNQMTSLLGDLGVGFSGIEMEVVGRDYIDKVRPAVFVFNHQSYLDAVVLAQLLRRDAVPLCKHELASNPILGPILKAAGTIFVDRDKNQQQETMQAALATLADRRSLVIAPEGTRSADGRLMPFKAGAFYLAKRAGVPVVPIVLHNVNDALPKGNWLIRPERIRVSVLPPVDLTTLRTRDALSLVESMYRDELGQSQEYRKTPYAEIPTQDAA